MREGVGGGASRPRATSILPANTWDPSTAADTLQLDYDHRHRRRITLRTQSGAEILLDLPNATRLRHNDGLLLDSGAIIRVTAAPEPLLEIHAHHPDDRELSP